MEKIITEHLKKISALMIKKKLTIAIAESCTSGFIQYSLSHAEEAMSFYQGGITVYNLGQKSKQLNINPITAEKCNSVSEDIAKKMALQVAANFNAECGISITGFGEPIPEKGIASCFAYIAVAIHSEIVCSKKINGNSKENLKINQRLYTEKVLSEFLIALEKTTVQK